MCRVQSLLSTCSVPDALSNPLWWSRLALCADRALPRRTGAGKRASKEIVRVNCFTNCGLLYKCGLLWEDTDAGQGTLWNGKEKNKGVSGAGVEAVGRRCGEIDLEVNENFGMKKCLCFQNPLSRVTEKYPQGSNPGVGGIRIAQGMDNQSWSSCQRRIVFSERCTALACASTPFTHDYRHLQSTTSLSLMDLGNLPWDLYKEGDLDHCCPIKFDTRYVCNLKYPTGCILKCQPNRWN